MRFIVILIVCLVSTEVFGQDNFIETKYSRIFDFYGANRLQHIHNNIRLDDDGLRRQFNDNTNSLNLLQTAKRDKRIGLPIVIIGSAGMISSLFLSNNGSDSNISDFNFVFHSSLVVGSVGGLFINSYMRNRMRAVNNYNNSIYEELALGDLEPLIDLEYGQNPFRFMSYYREGYRLNNKALTMLLGNQEHLRDLMRKANLQRGIGTGLTIAGTIGMFAGTALLYEEGRSGLIVSLTSLASFASGIILLNASRANRQTAVNLYNKQLFESATGTASLNFKLNPNAGGLVLNF